MYPVAGLLGVVAHYLSIRIVQILLATQIAIIRTHHTEISAAANGSQSGLDHVWPRAVRCASLIAFEGPYLTRRSDIPTISLAPRWRIFPHRSIFGYHISHQNRLLASPDFKHLARISARHGSLMTWC